MAAQTIQLKGSVPENNHSLIGPAVQTENIEVTIKLRRKSEDGLPTLDEFVAGKRAVGVTRAILEQRYGASEEDADAVVQWAEQNGLKATDVELGKRQIHLEGSVGAMSQAFGVKMSMYKHARTKTNFRCPEGDIQIPSTLATIITGVFGLNDMPVVVRHSTRPVSKMESKNPKEQFAGSFYPNEVAQLYSFPPTQGADQKVAVLEFGGGFDSSVLASYFKENIGLAAPPTVNFISVLGTQMNVDDPTTGEVYLDIEVIGAMAPKATIDVYFAPWTGQGYMNAIDDAIHNDDYAAVSISYGLDEDLRGDSANPGWPMLNQNIDEAFRGATAVGLPLFVSTGDQGSSSLPGQLDGEEITLYSPIAHAGYPATSPYATAVGGTMLYAKDGAIEQEIVWNELGPLEQGKFYYGGATGGGVSDRYKTVPSYQSNAGVTPKSANNPGASGRGVPDVAGNAGTTTGYLVSQPPQSQPPPIQPVGGTSAAAPMWAALMACVRSALEKSFNGNVPVFFLNDFVYACGKSGAFRNVVGGRDFTLGAQGLEPGSFIATGNNRSTKVNGYDAAQGYNLCTGWGSPNGNQLLGQLQTWLAKQPKS